MNDTTNTTTSTTAPTLPHPPAHRIAYAHEKFALAVHFMAASQHTLRERVRVARDIFSPITEEDIPEAGRSDFKSFMARLSWAVDNGEGEINATLALISDDEVERIARLICDVETSLAFAYAMKMKGWTR